MEQADVIVIGAGVVGLAIARSLAKGGRDVIVVEAQPSIGSGTSSRNSEVIHAGIYYPQNSLKARLCVDGKAMLYDYCASRNIPYRRCGKLIVATNANQVDELHRIRAQAAANGVHDLSLLSSADVAALEPQVAAAAALSSPSTGIIDSHALMLSLQGEAEDHGAMVAFGTSVVGGKVNEGVVRIETSGLVDLTVEARLAINAAGLDAQSVSSAIEGVAAERIPPLFLAKGNYFVLSAPSPFQRLIYPTPERGGLGIHATIDLAGATRFGPDVEWIDSLDYSVDPGRAERFYAAIRSYWPNLPDGSLAPGYAGIRPKVAGPTGSAGDFVFDLSHCSQGTGFAALYGIESPGLTASLAIAEHVVGALTQANRHV